VDTRSLAQSAHATDPTTRAGDPFDYADSKLQADDQDCPCGPCGCWDGWHWLGIAVEDPNIADDDGFVYEPVACVRCQKRP